MRPLVAAPLAPLPPLTKAKAPPVVLLAENVSVSKAAGSSEGAAADEPPTGATVAAEQEGNSAPAESVGVGCTTILVRRDGAYVLKVVRDERCAGCDVCRAAPDSDWGATAVRPSGLTR